MTDRRWFVCECGERLYEHASRRGTGEAGHTYGACRKCPCEGFVSELGQRVINGALVARAKPAAPTPVDEELTRRFREGK